MARVPTITLCWMTSDRFPTARNVRVFSENTAPNKTRTTSGPTAGVAKTRPRATAPRLEEAAAFDDMATFFHLAPDKLLASVSIHFAKRENANRRPQNREDSP